MRVDRRLNHTKIEGFSMKNINKTYVIGDVHGCFFTLKKLLLQLPSDADIIFIGDLVDKGNFSKEVIELVKNNNYRCILGNHELLMLQNIEEILIDKKGNDWLNVEYLGGYTTVKSYKNDLCLLETHLEWIKELPRYIEVDEYFITHGFSLPYYKRKDDKASHRALISNRPSDKEEWGYDWEKDYKNYDVINIYGHAVVEKVDTHKNYIGIDTGCVYGKTLTALELGTLKIFTQKVDTKDTAETLPKCKTILADRRQIQK
jgi:serine/threonine protein phosphatase 1